ncbi:MAG: GntR family transcriptional regulator [Actinomycetaceae bacterium]|nr:GntR family transcriptional regulator [Actinomycetaceae bacterium]
MMSDKLLQDVMPKWLSGDVEGDTLKATKIAGKVPNKADAAFGAIKEFILKNHLKPGTPLPPEIELSESLGVSRSSVREALRRLQALDIVKIEQGKGSSVGDMSLRGFAETLILRIFIGSKSDTEALAHVVALRKYLDLGSAADIVNACRGTRQEELREIAQGMVEKANRGENFLAEDIAFHERMVEMTQNPIAKEVTGAMWLAHRSGMQVLQSENQDRLVESAKAHLLLLNYAEQGNLIGYQGAVIGHYRPIEENLTECAQKSREP